MPVGGNVALRRHLLRRIKIADLRPHLGVEAMDGAEEAQLVGSLSARAFSALTPRAYQRIASAPPPSSNTFLRNQPWRNQPWRPPGRLAEALQRQTS